MLTALVIKNYVLIDNTEIEFKNGFSAITGETGAGKSILLGALSLILGARTDISVLSDIKQKCVVEGHFDILGYDIENFFEDNDLDYDQYLTLRREISTEGKSRAFINDTPVNLSVLKQLGEFLVNIHSQNKNTSLNNIDYQLEMVDDFAVIQDVVNLYGVEYYRYKELKDSLDKLIFEEQQAEKQKDFLDFLYKELENASVKENEELELEEQLHFLTNAEEIKKAIQSVINCVEGDDYAILPLLNDVKKYVKDITNLCGDRSGHLNERIESIVIELKDIINELSAVDQKTIYDREKIEVLSERLDLINRLEQKHKVTNTIQLLEIKNEVEIQLSAISSIADQVFQKQRELDIQIELVSDLANRISDLRKKIIPDFEQNIEKIVWKLGMPDAKIKIEHCTLENFSASGRDKIIFTFTANKGGELKEISKIASGGEISRLMLALKALICFKKKLPTIVFDEIDTGVSGDIAAKMGEIMKTMSENMQVIAITHLPQIASKANEHLYVYKYNDKDSTYSKIVSLDDNRKVEEIAKMLSGENVTDAALMNAKQLLNEKG